MKIKMILIALTALLSLASCGDDDSGLQLTQDEIIGDINTGKKIVITSLILPPIRKVAAKLM